MCAVLFINKCDKQLDKYSPLKFGKILFGYTVQLREYYFIVVGKVCFSLTILLRQLRNDRKIESVVLHVSRLAEQLLPRLGQARVRKYPLDCSSTCSYANYGGTPPKE